MAAGFRAGRDSLSDPSRRALVGIGSGAVIGGLLWAALDALGFWTALKSNLVIGPFAISLLVGAISGVIPALRRALWVAAAATVLLLAIVSFTPLASALTRSFVRADMLRPENLDAIVVLSGGLTPDGAMDSQSLDRLLKGIEVARRSTRSPLVLSRETLERDGRAFSDSADQAHVLALTAVSVPVLFIDSATSTRDEALRVKRLPGAKDWKGIGLITSPFHTRRACAVFERVGFVVTCIPAESRDRAIHHLYGAGDRLRAFQGWLYEMAGTTNYRMKGWI